MSEKKVAEPAKVEFIIFILTNGQISDPFAPSLIVKGRGPICISRLSWNLQLLP